MDLETFLEIIVFTCGVIVAAAFLQQLSKYTK